MASHGHREGAADYSVVTATEHTVAYLEAAEAMVRPIEPDQIDRMAGGLAGLRERGGRLFMLGVVGGAWHASRGGP